MTLCIVQKTLKTFCFVVNKLYTNNASENILRHISDSKKLMVPKTDLVCITANFSFLLQLISELEQTTNLQSETTKGINPI
jgi:hypothetical protein